MNDSADETRADAPDEAALHGLDVSDELALDEDPAALAGSGALDETALELHRRKRVRRRRIARARARHDHGPARTGMGLQKYAAPYQQLVDSAAPGGPPSERSVKNRRVLLVVAAVFAIWMVLSFLL